MKKVLARIPEVKFQPGSGKPGSRLTRLTFSLYTVISARAEILHVKSQIIFTPAMWAEIPARAHLS